MTAILCRNLYLKIKTKYKNNKRAKLIAKSRENASRKKASVFLKMEVNTIKEEMEESDDSSPQVVSAKSKNIPAFTVDG